MMTYEEAEYFIHNRPRAKKSEGRKSIRRLLELLGNPQEQLKFIHIAGTNGKGSCAAMSASVLRQAGYKVGMNISPYVIEFRERIQINGEFIPKDKLAEITERIRKLCDKLRREEDLIVLEFEVVTSIAFTWFAMEKCDAVVLEVGMGGLRDATNVISDNMVACIMNIAFDHTGSLGNTLSEIAYQKAGIIKPGRPVIRYPAMEKEAMDTINAVAKEKGSEVIQPPLGKIKMERTGFMKSRMEYGGLIIDQAFTGIHQTYNATVVIEAMRTLRRYGFRITDDDIKRGIEATRFPARIEVIQEHPLVILDGGHNIDGVTALVKVLRENNLHGLTAVWASLKDKHPEQIVRMMAPYVDRLYTVPLHGNRAVDTERLAEMARKTIPESCRAPDVRTAIDMARENMNENGLLVFGSLYLAGDAREYLKELFE